MRRLEINGLRVELVHQPDARQAAALIQVGAGSHDEPDRWPGLAHLLEHLLFTGSAGWPDDGRLMSWIAAQGGRVNATTLARRSAWFFEVAPPQLADGLARLQDMLCHPLLDHQAIRQEIAVIEAEYQLIQQHQPSRTEAALLHAATSPPAFRRFQIGSRASFGEEMTALQQALRQFHQRHFYAANMQLWLQGPQSLDQLEQLARTFAAALPDGQWQQETPRPMLSVSAGLRLANSTPAALWRSWLLDSSDGVTLWREFLLDEAPGSLLATLRQQRLADRLSLKWLYQADNAVWLALSIDTDQPEAVNALFGRWLAALKQTRQPQQQHYLQLAQQRFAALTPLDQLRERAFGFAPQAGVGAFASWLATLADAPGTTLVCSPQAAEENCHTQGFSLALHPWQPVLPAASSAAEFAFYPLAAPLTHQPLPSQAVPLPHYSAAEPTGHGEADSPTAEAGPDADPASNKTATLLLRPEFFSTFSAAVGHAYGRRLRPLFAALRHSGGQGEWQEVEGVWQLTLQLPHDLAVADWALHQLVQALTPPVDDEPLPPPDTIAIRALLQQLPYQLTSTFSPACWRALLTGGSPALQTLIARRLSALPLPVNPAAPPMRMTAPSGMIALPHASCDNALLLFIPLHQASRASPQQAQQLAALRALALLYEPRFFQRYRVEQQIGYVVSSRYLRCADQDGVLFALQSPDYSALSLLRYCRNFLRSLNEALAGCDLVALKASLHRERLDTPLARLRQLNGLTDPDAAAIEALDVVSLQQLHHDLIQARRRWRVLFTTGGAT